MQSSPAVSHSARPERRNGRIAECNPRGLSCGTAGTNGGDRETSGQEIYCGSIITLLQRLHCTSRSLLFGMFSSRATGRSISLAAPWPGLFAVAAFQFPQDRRTGARANCQQTRRRHGRRAPRRVRPRGKGRFPTRPLWRRSTGKMEIVEIQSAAIPYRIYAACAPCRTVLVNGLV